MAPALRFAQGGRCVRAPKRPSAASLPCLSPQPRQHPLELRARARGHAIPPEAGLVLEEQCEPQVDVVPAEEPAADLPRRRLECLVRLADRDEDFAAVGAPAGDALVAEALVSEGEAGEVGVDRLVLARGG